jgi:hypothetical protein
MNSALEKMLRMFIEVGLCGRLALGFGSSHQEPASLVEKLTDPSSSLLTIYFVCLPKILLVYFITMASSKEQLHTSESDESFEPHSTRPVRRNGHMWFRI